MWINLVGIILSALLISFFGLIVYKYQKNYEEIRDFYLKEGLEYLHQEISQYFATFQNNYEILMALLKNIRDYVPGVSISFEDIKINLLDYYPKGFAFRSIQNVAYLLDNDIVTIRTFNLFSYLSASRILFNETYFAIKRLIDNHQDFLNNEESRQRHYEDLSKDIEEKRKLIYDNLYILDIIANLINRIRDKFYFYITVNGLKKKLKNDSEIQKLLSFAVWIPVLIEMKKAGVPITAFLGSFKPDKEYQDIRIKRWEEFKKLIRDKHVEPCTYEESTSPTEIQTESEKWREFFGKKDNEKYSGAYKLSKKDDSDIEKIKEILIKGYLTK
jgi:hypothetical protein